jgi:hypothetical protein
VGKKKKEEENVKEINMYVKFALKSCQSTQVYGIE